MLSDKSIRNYHTTFDELFLAPNTEAEVIDAHLEFYKRINADPGFYWEIVREEQVANEIGEADLFDGLGATEDTEATEAQITQWKKWAGRQYFKDVTAKGKEFEEHVVQNLSGTADQINADLKATVLQAGIDLTEDFNLYTNVYLEYRDGNPGKQAPHDVPGTDRTITYFIADQVIQQDDKWVIIENKLSSTTSLTINQKHAFQNIDHFRVVSLREAEVGNEDLAQGDVISTSAWVKVHDGTDPGQISGAEILERQ